MWKWLSPAGKKKKQDEWAVESVKREASRLLGHLTEHIPPERTDEFNQLIKTLRQQYALPPAPAMPCLSHAVIAKNGRPMVDFREHEEHFADVGSVSPEWLAMVHTPVKMEKAMRIPEAKKAVDAEWDKLANIPAYDLNSVCERDQVKARGIRSKVTIHFGHLMDLCFVKHSEMSIEFHKYKGRCVFRGDQVRDESGFYAVFSEQGTSASHIAAAKMLDAIGRLPGCIGEDADATSAYTQVILSEMQDYHNVETWITLPPGRRPKSWSKFKDPVCLLTRNLYGHPLAGLLWEKYSFRVLTSLGFEPIQGWECLFVHRKDKLFLSVYVDDYKMAGKAENVSKMWAKMRAKVNGKPLIELGDPVSFHNSTYLGSTQENVTVPASVIEAKSEVYRTAWNAKTAGGEKGSIDKRPHPLRLLRLSQRVETLAMKKKSVSVLL
jgi:hypothetical protein